ncbi:Ribosomal protein L9/RNase H1, N-terminal [Sesbania bispinosa]|nr:Ribosomal protein L9/RNase H1, N-terminal [Sesbania bispinosa]
MSSSRDVKFYVVFHGRQPGIYGSWEECESQVLVYSGNKHKSFKTLEEAQIAWAKHCEKMSHFHNYTQYADDGHHKQANPGGSSSNSDKQKTPLHDMGINKNMILEEDGSDEFIIHCSMQEWLTQVCHTLRITQPRITLAEVMNFKGVTYYRYFASLQTNNGGPEHVQINGKFAANNKVAREDVALQLLRILLEGSGKKIMDYNYNNVVILEDQIKKYQKEIMELHAENSFLSETVLDLRKKVGDV